MGKTVKVLLVLALLVGISCFTLGVISAQQAGMTIEDLAKTVQSNLEELNISPVVQEYSEIQETMSMEDHRDKPRIVIRNSFPDVTIMAGDEFKVELLGDVSSKLDNLLSWSADMDTIYVNIASVFNENPSSTGLVAVVTLPQDVIEEINVTSVSGDVTLLDLPIVGRGTVEVKSGTVQVLNSQIQDLFAVTQSGNIKITNTEEEMKADLATDSGDINVYSSSLSGEIKTDSGLIAVETDGLHDDLTLDSLSGNVEILYRGPQLKYKLSTESGWLTVDYEGFQRRVSGEIGKDGYFLNAVSATGSVNLRLE